MTDTITITGLVATVPRHLITGEGLSITSFRLASAQRRFDRGTSRWIDGETNWYTVTAFRQLAVNSATSISKGQRVVVAGRLRIREWDSGEKTGTTVDVEADAIGHDLAWGTTSFTRSISSSNRSLPDDQKPGDQRPDDQRPDVDRQDPEPSSEADVRGTEPREMPAPEPAGWYRAPLDAGRDDVTPF